MTCLDHREGLWGENPVSNTHKQRRKSLLIATHWQENEPNKRKGTSGLADELLPPEKIAAPQVKPFQRTPMGKLRSKGLP